MQHTLEDEVLVCDCLSISESCAWCKFKIQRFLHFFGNPYVVSARLSMDLFQYNTYECCGMHTYHYALLQLRITTVQRSLVAAMHPAEHAHKAVYISSNQKILITSMNNIMYVV